MLKNQTHDKRTWTVSRETTAFKNLPGRRKFRMDLFSGSSQQINHQETPKELNKEPVFPSPSFPIHSPVFPSPSPYLLPFWLLICAWWATVQRSAIFCVLFLTQQLVLEKAKWIPHIPCPRNRAYYKTKQKLDFSFESFFALLNKYDSHSAVVSMKWPCGYTEDWVSYMLCSWAQHQVANLHITQYDCIEGESVSHSVVSDSLWSHGL